SVVQRSDSNSTDVGHEGVITGRDGFSLRSPIDNPQGVAQSPLQSTKIMVYVLAKSIPTFSDGPQLCICYLRCIHLCLLHLSMYHYLILLCAQLFVERS
ncbi:hypothetical protein, partial [Lysinibacillus sp. NPDC059133]|uniref:hypothetical protein n=1 Tax=Lysinibacillus sp. NPDC059133 TaxID=3346737 RepID=UPI0036B44D5D